MVQNVLVLIALILSIIALIRPTAGLLQVAIILIFAALLASWNFKLPG